MGNMTIHGVTCPDCGGAVYVRASGYGGSSGGYFHPGDPPEVCDIEEARFEECDCDLRHGSWDEDSGNYERNFITPADQSFWSKLDARIDAGEVEVDTWEPSEP